jgi:hypothetical protein
MDTTIAATHEHDSPVHFPPDEERELRQEDSAAWHDIVKILLGIISIGVILAITCVYFTLNL